QSSTGPAPERSQAATTSFRIHTLVAPMARVRLGAGGPAMNMRQQRRLFGVTETRVGLQLGDGLPFERWVALMRRVSRDRSANQWRLGDLVRFGEAHYGRMYEQVIAESGLSY